LKIFYTKNKDKRYYPIILAYFKHSIYFCEENFEGRRGKPSDEGDGVDTYVEPTESMVKQRIHQNYPSEFCEENFEGRRGIGRNAADAVENYC
jgi:hypothetical protein